MQQLTFLIGRDSAIRCTKMAEPIKMQFRMLSRVGLNNIITWDVDTTMGQGTFGVWLIENHCKA